MEIKFYQIETNFDNKFIELFHILSDPQRFLLDTKIIITLEMKSKPELIDLFNSIYSSVKDKRERLINDRMLTINNEREAEIKLLRRGVNLNFIDYMVRQFIKELNNEIRVASIIAAWTKNMGLVDEIETREIEEKIKSMNDMVKDIYDGINNKVVAIKIPNSNLIVETQRTSMKRLSENIINTAQDGISAFLPDKISGKGK